MSGSKPEVAAFAAGAETDSEKIAADICVIGAGPAGLAVATAAAAFGRSVVLIERQRFGGDALNSGCIPLRALAAVGARAHGMRTAGTFGIGAREPEIDMRAVHSHVENVVSSVAPNFAPERFVGLGVRVIHATARFVDRRTVMAGEHRIRARRFVIATGSTPSIPSITGLDSVPYFTTETIFDNRERINSLIVLGAGPVALELAQAYSRLGARVMVLDAGTALPDEDPELAKLVLDSLADEGIAVHQGAKVESVEGGLGRIRVNVSVDADRHVVEGSHLLVVDGRKPATADLGLDAARIRHDGRGIKVGPGLKTTNRRVFAVGTVAGGTPHSQVADYHAGIVISRALLRLPARVDGRLIPRATFTDPELAYVGLSEAEAMKGGKKIHVLRWPFRENDRAQADSETAGHVKVVTAPDGRILGAGIVGARAGELIQLWSLAIAQNLNIKAMTRWNPPYPTLGEINKRVASSYYAGNLASPTLRKIINLFAKLG